MNTSPLLERAYSMQRAMRVREEVLHAVAGAVLGLLFLAAVLWSLG